MQYKLTGIELPIELNKRNLPRLMDEILRAAFDGRISIEDAERLKRLITDQPSNNASLTITTNDPVEASKIYQRIMMA